MKQTIFTLYDNTTERYIGSSPHGLLEDAKWYISVKVATQELAKLNADSDVGDNIVVMKHIIISERLF